MIDKDLFGNSYYAVINGFGKLQYKTASGLRLGSSTVSNNSLIDFTTEVACAAPVLIKAGQDHEWRFAACNLAQIESAKVRAFGFYWSAGSSFWRRGLVSINMLLTGKKRRRKYKLTTGSGAVLVVKGGWPLLHRLQQYRLT